MQVEKEGFVWDLPLGTMVCIMSLAKEHGYLHAMGRITRYEVIRLSGYPDDPDAERVPGYRIELVNPPTEVYPGESFVYYMSLRYPQQAAGVALRVVTVPRGAIEPTATELFIDKMRRQCCAGRAFSEE